MNFDFNDAICAISTPPGSGAIAIVRLSGKKILPIVSKIFFDKDSHLPKELKPRKATFGIIRHSDEIIDEVISTYFPAPGSYTGQDVIEIACHGSTYIQRKIMETLIELGCRTALPGEFTMRAFLNRKIDLTQAESIANLINARNATAHRIAMSQMKGSFSKRINTLSDKLLNLLSLVELELDFGDEDVEFAQRDQLRNLLQEIELETRRLYESYRLGQTIKNGIPVAIVGHPNAGKSTLLNQLLQEERAIVSEIPGTTRDAIEDTITFRNVEFRFIDTAGIRQSSDHVEKIGIARSLEKIETAWIILFLFDCTENIKTIIETFEQVTDKIQKDQRLILIANKIDLVLPEQQAQIFSEFTAKTGINNAQMISISAKTDQNIDLLINKLEEIARELLPEEGDVIVSNTRQYELLHRILQSLSDCKNALDNNRTSEILAFELRQVQHLMGELTGTVITADMVLGNIFQNFCIGK
ncbi:MAG TPA: tRNA uridine-5-carboxymethylaminomethyl(34) synthesis GTPase MnmE [Salinivirgaceae bacterium]|nr:tRNA uridine-5-carboxymethylaminomethyl(34) synthesis GTPase MnmE [Salinivirgaceae bacterium]